MGVLACDRPGCDECMCSTCVENHYYVCHECKKEFAELIGDQLFDKDELLHKFREFMETEKPDPPQPEVPREDLLSVGDWLALYER